VTPTDATPDVTLAELLRRLNRIESKIDSSVFVSKDIFELVMKSTNDRLSKVEAAQTWATRLMIGAFTTILAEGAILALTLVKP
jgi:hypothetical protein